MHSFRKPPCGLHWVLISSGSPRVSVWCMLEAELQIASLQSDLQTLARLEQKHNPPPGLALVWSWGSGYHMCSASVFTSCTAVQYGTSATVQASPRGAWQPQLNGFQMLRAFCCRDILERTNPSTRTAVFLCVFFPFFGPLQHCSDFPLIPCWVWSSGDFCLWPQSEHTCRLWGIWLFLLWPLISLVLELADANSQTDATIILGC